MDENCEDIKNEKYVLYCPAQSGISETKCNVWNISLCMFWQVLPLLSRSLSPIAYWLQLIYNLRYILYVTEFAILRCG